MNIANRIMLWVLVASLAVLVPMSYFSYRTTYKVMMRQVEMLRPLFTQNMEMNITREHAVIETTARMITLEIVEGKIETPEDFQSFFTRCLQEPGNEAFFGFIYAAIGEEGGAGIVEQCLYLHRHAQNDAPVLVDLLKRTDQTPVDRREWFIPTYETRSPHWSKPYRGRTTGDPMVTYAVPVIGEDNRLCGILACDITLDWIDSFIKKLRLPRSEIEQVFLLAEDGTVLADKQWGMLHDNIFEIAAQRNDADLARIAREMLTGQHGERDYRSPDGKIVGRIIYTPVDADDGDDNAADWSLGVFIPIETIHQYAFWNGGVQAVIGIAGMIFLVIAIRIVANGISRPIRQLQKSALEIASGNLDATIPHLPGRDEIALLAESFTRMQTDLKTHIVNLAATTRMKEQMESELRIGRTIQMSLVPTRIPETSCRDLFDLAAFMEPARQVGGDFYDYFMVEPETLCLVIADVSGKGVPAALLMARSSALFRSLLSNERRLNIAVEHLNRELCRGNDACMFITFFAMCVHLPTGRTDYVNAGHNPPFLVSPKGESSAVRTLEPDEHVHSLPLGIDEDCVYTTRTLTLHDGDIVFLYTDGVTEALNPESALFGEERTIAALERAVEESSERILETVRRAILEYIRQTPQSDDITMLALRYGAVSGDKKLKPR